MDATTTDKRTQILIVDDDDVFRQGLRRILARHGYACEEAASASEALATLAAVPGVAAALCDVRMPGESGIDLARTLAADHPDVAVLMTTGEDDLETAELALEIGAYAYLTKPFTPNEILIALSGALRRRELERARSRQLRDAEAGVVRSRALSQALTGLDAEGGAEEAIELLARAISLRDEETARHIDRMSRYALLLAQSTGTLDLPEDQYRVAAAMHDVGKIGVPDSVLLKPGPLAPDEVVAMRRHAQIGYQLLAGSGRPAIVTAGLVALCHHEWWDGGGYPRGLVGEEIPVVARVAGIADVFDALTSHRVYRPALEVAAALEIMVGLRDRQFEGRLLDAFLEAIPDVLAIRTQLPDEDPEPRIRVLAIDDHEIFVHSLARLLATREGIRLVGTAGTVAAGVAAATLYVPDVVLMDFELPDGDGVQATREIKARMPFVRVVMLTGRADRDAFVRAVAAGCAGFVNKTDPVEVLVAAIRTAHEGEMPAMLAELPGVLDGLPTTRRGLGTDLRPRELAVLELMASGLPNKAIAQRLHVSLDTVRNHVQSILYKLDAHSKLEAVATAAREGLVERGGVSAEG
jgi:putative two-component system response regulator